MDFTEGVGAVESLTRPGPAGPAGPAALVLWFSVKTSVCAKGAMTHELHRHVMDGWRTAASL